MDLTAHDASTHKNMAVNPGRQGSGSWNHVPKGRLIWWHEAAEEPQGAARRVRKKIRVRVAPSENSIIPAFQSGLIRLV